MEKLVNKKPNTKSAPSIGLSEDNRAGAAEILNHILANESVLYTKTRNFHWNVTGPLFYSLHNLLEEQYQQLATSIDEIAERSRQMGFRAIGSMQEFLDLASLKESKDEKLSDTEMVARLVKDHESLIESMRVDIEKLEDELQDAGNADFVTALLQEHEKMAWMLRSLLK
ncbi:starvation-inducible DNA-binding protein [Catalinimonas alkaloidigena]|uniref:Dps family protein n=1 Tax=Catalinimonas alkaloidigena TaxID=1075417 RepID=UPI002404C074|nr:DNA starvation/stationary phase protection protein [Catalinimonas alkaloidigena]MDF9797641.1 starvation-inducible DNA-binding protein [Catalinimonas alkaloidigena]